MSHALDLYAKDNSDYIVHAGFEIKQPLQAYTGILLPPEILQARSNGMPGQLEVSCKIPQRILALMTVVEWSIASFYTSLIRSRFQVQLDSKN